MSSSLSDLDLLAVGTARDCGKTIRGDVFRLYEALKTCRRLSWFVVESDSADGTVRELESLAKEVPGFRFISFGNLRETLSLRTQRIAHCRNAYLKELRSNPLYAEVGYLVVADLDGTNELVTAEGFASCWSRGDWGACTANQRGPYYDIWALRHNVWSPGDCLEQVRFLTDHGVEAEAASWAGYYAKMIEIDRAEEWIEVDSAFGGLAVYRREALENANYVGSDEAGRGVCEHVALNCQIRDNGYKIFINPQLINAGEISHSRERVLTKRAKDRIAGRLRDLKWKLLGPRLRK